jgi:hypothetical protein
MHVTPLEFGLVALVLVVAFGPKRLPNFKRSSNSNVVDLSSLAPSQPAAGRAPSPLSHSTAPPAQQPVAQQPAPQQQYAMSGPSSPQPLKLPNEL